MIGWLRRRRTPEIEPVGEVLLGYLDPVSGRFGWIERVTDRPDRDPAAASERSEQVDREDRSPLPATTSAPAPSTLEPEWRDVGYLTATEVWQAEGR